MHLYHSVYLYFYATVLFNQYLTLCYFRGLMELVGIVVGHIYFFLMFKYPQDFGGVRLLNTPQIL